MLITVANAIIELNRLAQSDECPTLTIPEQQDILIKFKRAELWTAATVVQLGETVIPTLANRNGHRYVALDYTGIATDQKTGTTEPNWTKTRDARTTDGSIIWAEAGWDWDAVLWDLQSAAEEAWRVKALKTVGRVDFSTAQGIRINAAQLHDHCLAMAKQFHRSFLL